LFYHYFCSHGSIKVRCNQGVPWRRFALLEQGLGLRMRRPCLPWTCPSHATAHQKSFWRPMLRPGVQGHRVQEHGLEAGQSASNPMVHQATTQTNTNTFAHNQSLAMSNQVTICTHFNKQI
jgi:hypothetical protein